MKIPVLLPALLLAFFSSHRAHAACLPLTYSGLEQLVRNEGDKHVVFFSSWCSGCKESLTRPLPANTILVAAFDKPERAQKVVEAFKLEQPCYMDDGIAQKLGVKVVPAVVDVKKQKPQ